MEIVEKIVFFDVTNCHNSAFWPRMCSVKKNKLQPDDGNSSAHRQTQKVPVVSFESEKYAFRMSFLVFSLSPPCFTRI